MEMYITVPIYSVHVKKRSIEELERKSIPLSENGVNKGARVE